MVRHLGHVEAAHAQPAFVVGILRVAFALDELAVLVRVKQDAAPVMTSGTGPCTATRDGQAVLLVAPRLLVLDELIVADELGGYTAIVVSLYAVVCHVLTSSVLSSLFFLSVSRVFFSPETKRGASGCPRAVHAGAWRSQAVSAREVKRR